MKNAFEYEAELAALREELASQKAHYVEQLRGAKSADKLQAELTSAMVDIDDIVVHNTDLQQRLADAERRNADMVRLLTRARIYARGEFGDEIDACLKELNQ